VRALGFLIAAALVGPAGVLAGTGSSSTTLVFTRAGGTRIPFPKTVSVFCGPWESNPRETPVKTPSLHVRVATAGRREAWELVAVLRDVHAGTVAHLPHNPVYTRPTKAVMTLYDGPTRNEASSATETARGTITFLTIGCNPARVEFSVDATLGSEFFEGPSVRVRGDLRARR
jgi:hypothetical protein